jgi:hypothetical protein
MGVILGFPTINQFPRFIAKSIPKGELRVFF